MKTLKQALSLALSVLLLASTLFIGATAEETTTILNATELPVNFYNGTNNAYVSADTKVDGMSPTYGDVYSAAGDLDPLVPEFPSTRLTYGWNKDGNSLDKSDLASFYKEAKSKAEDPEISEDEIARYTKIKGQKILRYIDLEKLGVDSLLSETENLIDVYTEDKSKGLMFYIKLHEDSADTRLYLEAITVAFKDDKIVLKSTGKEHDQLYNGTVKNQSVYLMPAGADSWSQVTALNGEENGFRYGEKATNASLSLPGGYEGWVYMPASTWLNYTTKLDDGTVKLATYKYLSRIDWFVDELVAGKDLQLSNIMVVNGDVTTAEGVTTGDKTYAFASNRFYSGTALSVNDVEMSLDGFYDFIDKDGQLAAGYGANNTYLNTNFKLDSYEDGLTPDAYYPITPIGANKNPQNAQRPKPDTGWEFTKVTQVVDNDTCARYHMDAVTPNPFAIDGYTEDTTHEKLGVTYREQYDSRFNADGEYIGGTCQTVGLKTADSSGKPHTQTNVTFASAVVDAYKTESIVGKSVMFYINHIYDDGIENKQPMNVAFMLTNHVTDADDTYYTYDIKTGKWETKTFVAPENRGSLNKKVGVATFAPDFEGWVMIPATSFFYNDTENATVLGEFKVAPECFGGKYGELIFGDITVVDDLYPFAITKDSAFLSSNGVYPASDFPFIASTTAPVKTTASTNADGGNGGIDGLTRSGITFTAADTFVPKISGGKYTSINLSRLGFKNGTETLKAGTNKALALKIDNTSGGKLTAIFGTNYLYMSADSPYYLLADSRNKIESCTTSSDTYQIVTGTTNRGKPGASITIPERFVGYVIVPFSTFNENIAEDRDMLRVDFFPITMSGSMKIESLSLLSTEFASIYYKDAEADTKIKGMNSSISELIPVSEAVAEVLTIADGVLTNESDELYADFKVNGTVKADEAIMFYAKNDAKTAVSFKTSIGNNSSAMAYSVADSTWTGVYADGKITLDAGFEGWVKIAVTADTDFDSIRFTFNSLANGFAVSDFMVANYSADLEFIKRGTSVRTGLFYSKGDFNLDANTDILDAVLAKSGYTIQHDITKFENEDDQLLGLRKYLLNH